MRFDSSIVTNERRSLKTAPLQLAADKTFAVAR